MKQRLDQYLVEKRLVQSRSQASNLIGLGKVYVNKEVATKAGHMVSEHDVVVVPSDDRYVSRAAYKLDSVVDAFGISFIGATVLDIGSSTGGFTDYALQHGAKRVVAVDVGTDQLHHSLRGNSNIELHEKTDIRDFSMDRIPGIILVDVSFISVTRIMEQLYTFAGSDTKILIMAKPQFEARNRADLHNGIVKNNRIRRDIFKQFEAELERRFKIIDSLDSAVAGNKGNVERFYYLKRLTR